MRLGIVGGGQLGRMLAHAANRLGCAVRVLTPDRDAPAAAVAEPVFGEYGDPEAIARFASGLDVATYEFENIPVHSVRELARRVRVLPRPDALESAQDRLAEKELFRTLGIPTIDYARVDTRAELDSAVKRLGLPALLKTRRLGYDGKGQSILRTREDVEAGWRRLGGVPVVLERFVAFDRELSILGARRASGESVFYPLVDNRHSDGILCVSSAPAPGADGALQQTAESYAVRMLEALDYSGVLAIELFDIGGTLYANEFAPRVHNSGHWTIEAAEASQFENHVRAVLDLPLGSASPLGHAVMVNLIGDVPELAALLAIPGAHVHLYGKTPRPGRKLGHVTFRGSNPAEVRERASRLESLLEESRLVG